MASTVPSGFRAACGQAAEAISCPATTRCTPPEPSRFRWSFDVTRALIDSALPPGSGPCNWGCAVTTIWRSSYDQLGFRVWGRPNVIEVGDERFEDVRMFLDLGRPSHLVLRGRSSRGAPFPAHS